MWLLRSGLNTRGSGGNGVHVSMRYETEPGGSGDTTDLEQRIGEALVGAGQTVAAAESLTGGAISSRLSAIEGASDWFRGAVVAYGEDVKLALLGVDRGPVFVAVQTPDGDDVREYHFDGDPAEVVRQTTERALDPVIG